MTKTILRMISVAFILSLLVTACAPANPQTPSVLPTANPPQQDTPTAPTESSPKETVKLTVSIIPFLSYAPIFIAKEE